MNLLETLTQSVPNAGPKTQALFNDAEQKLQMLESSGSNRAGVIRRQLADAISKGQNPSGLIKGLDKMYFSSLSKAEKSSSSSKDKPSIVPEDAIMQIENALNIADERAIKLSDQDIKSAAFAYGKGDLKGAAKIANKLVERIDTAIKLQDEEEKDIRTTAEGIQVAIGKKTGTVYTGGIPASRGRQNTESFSSFLGEKRKEDIATIPGVGAITQALPEGFTPAPEISQLETIKPQPDLYGQQTQREQMSALQEKEAAFKRARALYNSGDAASAIDIMNSAGGKGLLGPFTEFDLQAVFGAKQETPQQPPANQTAPQRPPLSGIIPIPQTPENK